MLLTIELNKKHPKIDISFDSEGLDLLIKKLEVIRKSKSHDHFMTESWAGNELTEKKQKADSTLIHQVDLRYIA